MSRPRVLLAITKSELGGAQRYVHQLVRLLPQQGFDRVVACGGDGWLIHRAREAGAEVIRVPTLSAARTFRGVSEILALRALERIVRDGQFAIVHGNSTRAGFLARLAAHRAGTPVVLFTAHGFFFEERMRGLRRTMYVTAERLAARWSDAIITVSDADRRAALKARLCPEDRLVTIRNGLDDESLLSLGRRREDTRRANRREQGGPVVGALANLYPTKGLDRLVRAMAEVRSSMPAARLVVVGEGPERARLEELARQIGIAAQVSFPGAMDDPWSRLAGVDVFVMPSVKEGLPFALIEAMAVGVPIVASRVGGIPEVVTDGRSALLVPPGDATGLSEAIVRLVRDPGLSARLGEQAQQDVRRQGLTAEAMVAATAKLYRELLARKNSSGRSPGGV